MSRGQVVKTKGQGIVGMGIGIPKIQSKNYRGTGKISHHAIVGSMDPIMQKMKNLNISGQGARKKDYDAPKPKSKKSRGSGNFKSVKFSFQ